MNLSEEEFKRLYLGDFVPSKRDKALYDRLTQYYRDTPDSMSNKRAQSYWREFKSWCSERNYTTGEINAMKRQTLPSR